MSNLYEMLNRIKKRPAMYLGKNSIFSLQAFLAGYNGAKREMGLLPTEEEEEFEYFLNWIRKRFKVETNQSWASIIVFYSADENKALDTFFELFDEFLVQRKNLELEKQV
ncbi:hypothetical protein IQ247_30760 [Plectonema cf. radiosum LEGE 06105]|uniref:Uncharacterized protein n=1 Tax=Plectonema cf. radiosum LEGE 06105 TaxID=945769 RepID=A0A8J7FIL2_9CYAN|nr:hypothetical protein [Plectonema radiosum]MBE9216983.1 hypothetical protein [Plectonema cf. radiosum LEGE 06105]